MINLKKKNLNKKKKTTHVNKTKSEKKTCNGRFKKKNCQCSSCNSKIISSRKV